MNIYNSFKKVVEENISQECRLKDVDETRNYFVEEIEQNELRSRKLKKKKLYTTPNSIEHSYFRFCNYRMDSISLFASLFGIHMDITSSAIGLNICVTAAAIKKN